MPSSLITRITSIPAIQRQSALSLAATLSITFFGFISTMIFSHLLGKDLMGIYYLFLAYYGIFNMIGDGGFGQAAVKRISEGHEQNEYLTAYATLRGLLIIFSTLLLLTFGPYIMDLSDFNYIPWILLALIAAYFGHTITYGVFGLGHVGIYNIANSVSDFFTRIIQIILVLLGYSLTGLFGGFIIGLIISGIICFKHFTFKPAKFSFRHINSLFSYGFWAFLISTGTIVFAYTDSIFIGFFMTNGDVGVYRTAYQFTTAAAFITIAISQTLTPKISNWSANGEVENISPALTRGITYSLILAVPVAAGGILLSGNLLYYFYGADFAAGATVCAILLLMQVINVFTYLFGTVLSAMDHAKQSFYATGSAALLNIILNIILIPTIGIEGAAIATLISFAVNCILIWYFLKRYITINIELRPILHIIMSVVPMVIFILIYLYFIPLSNVIITLIPVGVGALIYFFLLLKIDHGIHDELSTLAKQFGLPWPKWL